MSSVPKEVKELVREAEKQGWRAVPVKCGWQLLAPVGHGIVTVHKTPNSRGIEHYVREMRRYGFVWKGR